MKQGWEIKKLGEVCAFQRGLTYSKDDEVEHSNNCVLRSNNIDLDSMSIVLDELKYINDDFVVSEDKKVKPNTILICMSNGSKQHIGKVAFIDKEYGYAFGGFMGLIKPNTDVSPKFIYYSCISSSYKHFLAGIGNGANITNLKFSDLQQYTLPVPPREEQERIVAELDCLSGVIERKREQLRELDALAQSIFYQMFGDPITNEKGWKVKKLSDAVSIDCPISYGIVQPMDDVEGGIPIVRPIDLVDTFVRKDNLKRTSIDISNAYKRTILRGDEILMCVRGTTGVVSMASDELKGCNTTRGIVPLFFDSINRWFVYYLIKQQSMQYLIADNTYGIALKQINIKELRLLPIIAPPLTLQQEFADKIEAIEKQKELIKQSITQTEELFNSRMDYYFN